MQADDFDDASVVEGDLACMRCQYNLRTQTRGGVCPECGMSVRASMEFVRYGMGMKWRRLRAGVLLLLALPVVELLLILANWIAGDALAGLGVSPTTRMVMLLLVVGALAIARSLTRRMVTGLSGKARLCVGMAVVILILWVVEIGCWMVPAFQGQAAAMARVGASSFWVEALLYFGAIRFMLGSAPAIRVPDLETATIALLSGAMVIAFLLGVVRHALRVGDEMSIFMFGVLMLARWVVHLIYWGLVLGVVNRKISAERKASVRVVR